MSLSDGTFGQVYSDVYAAELGGDEIAIGAHASGGGVDVLSLADVSDKLGLDFSELPSWSEFAAEANAIVSRMSAGPVEAVFAASRPFIGSSAELAGAIGELDILSPDHVNIFHADHAAQMIGSMAEEKLVVAGNPEEVEALGAIVEDMGNARLALNEVMQHPALSILVHTDHVLHDAGYDTALVRDLVARSDAPNGLNTDSAPAAVLDHATIV